MTTKLDPSPNLTPEWPYDMARVIQAMTLTAGRPPLTVATLAAALNELGHAASARARGVEAMLFCQGGPGQGENPFALMEHRDGKLYGLELAGEVLSLDLDKGWEAMLLRFHRSVVDSDRRGAVDAPQEWDTSYSPNSIPDWETPELVAIEQTVALMQAHPTREYQAVIPATNPITSAVRELLERGPNPHAVAFALAAALRSGGIAAKPMLEFIQRPIEGGLALRDRVWVEYGSPTAQLAITDFNSEKNLSFITPNSWGPVKRDLKPGIHEISEVHMGPADERTMERSQGLVAAIVQAALEREVSQAGGAPRARM